MRIENLYALQDPRFRIHSLISSIDPECTSPRCQASEKRRVEPWTSLVDRFSFAALFIVALFCFFCASAPACAKQVNIIPELAEGRPHIFVRP